MPKLDRNDIWKQSHAGQSVSPSVMKTSSLKCKRETQVGKFCW